MPCPCKAPILSSLRTVSLLERVCVCVLLVGTKIKEVGEGSAVLGRAKIKFGPGQ